MNVLASVVNWLSAVHGNNNKMSAPYFGYLPQQHHNEKSKLKKLIISSYSINHLVFAMNINCVLCKAETEFLYAIWTNFSLKGENES
jgi:hypothetical protein